MRSREARLRDGDSTVKNIGKEAAQIQWKKNQQRTQAKTKHFEWYMAVNFHQMAYILFY